MCKFVKNNIYCSLFIKKIKDPTLAVCLGAIVGNTDVRFSDNKYDFVIL